MDCEEQSSDPESEEVEFDATSSKMDALIAILQDRSKHAKTVVFVPSRTLLLSVSTAMISCGITCQFVDSTHNVGRRAKTISSFQAGCTEVLVLPVKKAASIGITLTAASRVVFFGWVMDETQRNQAIGRVHRQSQMRPVLVHHLVHGGVEQCLCELNNEHALEADRLIELLSERRDDVF